MSASAMNRRGGPKIKIDLNPKSTTTEPQGLFQNGCSGDDSTVLGAYNNLPANVREMSGSVDTGFGSISSGLEETSSNYMAPTMNPIISNMVGEAISQGYSNGVEMKNPISQLQEVCVKYGLAAPSYDVGSEEGPPHARRFKLIVKAAGQTGEGVGGNKKLAKTEAARDVLCKILAQRNVNDSSSIQTSQLQSSGDPMRPAVSSAAVPVSSLNALVKGLSSVSLESDLSSNVVQLIIQFCQKNGFIPPEYHTIKEEGQSHDPTFTVACEIAELNLKALGVARSKQNAKREAALALWRQLQQYRKETPLNNKTSNVFATMGGSPSSVLKETLDASMRAQTIESPGLTLLEPFINNASLDRSLSATAAYFESVTKLEDTRFSTIINYQESVNDAPAPDFGKELKRILNDLDAEIRYFPMPSSVNASNNGVRGGSPNSSFKCVAFISSKGVQVMSSFGESMRSMTMAEQCAAARAMIMIISSKQLIRNT